MMFEEIKSKAEALKSKRDQAQGAIQSIKDDWMRKYGTDDVAVLEEKLRSMKTELEELNLDIEKKLAEAESILKGAEQ